MAAQARIVEERELQKRLAHVDALVGELQQLPDLASRALVEELLSTVLELHGEALSRMLFVLGPRGEPATDRLLELMAADDVIRGVLAAPRTAPARPAQPRRGRARVGPTVHAIARRWRRAARRDRGHGADPSRGALQDLSVVDGDPEAGGREGNLRGGARRRGDRGRRTGECSGARAAADRRPGGAPDGQRVEPAPGAAVRGAV